jgi:hypothetical protein
VSGYEHLRERHHEQFVARIKAINELPKELNATMASGGNRVSVDLDAPVRLLELESRNEDG